MDLPQFVILIQIKKKQCSSQLDLLDFFITSIFKTSDLLQERLVFYSNTAKTIFLVEFSLRFINHL